MNTISQFLVGVALALAPCAQAELTEQSNYPPREVAFRLKLLFADSRIAAINAGATGKVCAKEALRGKADYPAQTHPMTIVAAMDAGVPELPLTAVATVESRTVDFYDMQGAVYSLAERGANPFSVRRRFDSNDFTADHYFVEVKAAALPNCP